MLQYYHGELNIITDMLKQELRHIKCLPIIRRLDKQLQLDMILDRPYCHDQNLVATLGNMIHLMSFEQMEKFVEKYCRCFFNTECRYRPCWNLR